MTMSMDSLMIIKTLMWLPIQPSIGHRRALLMNAILMMIITMIFDPIRYSIFSYIFCSIKEHSMSQCHQYKELNQKITDERKRREEKTMSIDAHENLPESFILVGYLQCHFICKKKLLTMTK